MEYERAEPWYQGTEWFFKNLSQYYSMAYDYPWLGTILYIPQLLLFFAAVALLAYGVRERLGTGMMLYGAVYLLVTYTSSWMLSGGRYVMCIFPIFMALGRIARKRPLFALVSILCSACVLVYFSLCFSRGEAIM